MNSLIINGFTFAEGILSFSVNETINNVALPKKVLSGFIGTCIISKIGTSPESCTIDFNATVLIIPAGKYDLLKVNGKTASSPYDFGLKMDEKVKSYVNSQANLPFDQNTALISFTKQHSSYETVDQSQLISFTFNTTGGIVGATSFIS